MFSLFLRGQIRSISNIRIRKYEDSKLYYVEAIDSVGEEVYLGEDDPRPRAEDKVWEVMYRVNTKRKLDTAIIDVSDLPTVSGTSILLYYLAGRWHYQRDYLTFEGKTALNKAKYHDNFSISDTPHIIFTVDQDVDDLSEGRLIYEKFNNPNMASIPKSLMRTIITTFNKDEYINIQTADVLYSELD